MNELKKVIICPIKLNYIEELLQLTNMQMISQDECKFYRGVYIVKYTRFHFFPHHKHVLDYTATTHGNTPDIVYMRITTYLRRYYHQHCNNNII